MDNMTAKMSCFARAYHFNRPGIHVFEDPAAERLLGDEYRQIAGSLKQGVSFFLPEFNGNPKDGLQLVMERQLAPSVLGRSAFCERAWKNETRLGCEQVILFAAGYDSFSILHNDRKVFELDLPQVLADKKQRVEQAGLTSAAVYVPCDLSSGYWREALVQAGFEPGRKTFASLLGISYYLEKPAFGQLLNDLRSVTAEGSAICFDYPSAEESHETKTNQALAAGAGEAMKAVWSFEELERVLQDAGFLIYEHLNETEMTEQFFAAYNSGSPAHTMTAPKGVGYITAVNKENKYLERGKSS